MLKAQRGDPPSLSDSLRPQSLIDPGSLRTQGCHKKHATPATLESVDERNNSIETSYPRRIRAWHVHVSIQSLNLCVCAGHVLHNTLKYQNENCSRCSASL